LRKRISFRFFFGKRAVVVVVVVVVDVDVDAAGIVICIFRRLNTLSLYHRI